MNISAIKSVYPYDTEVIRIGCIQIVFKYSYTIKMSDLHGGAKVTMIFNYAAFNLKEKLIAICSCEKSP